MPGGIPFGPSVYLRLYAKNVLVKKIRGSQGFFASVGLGPKLSSAPFTSGSKWRYYDPSITVVLGWALRLFFDLFVRLSSVDAASAADRA